MTTKPKMLSQEELIRVSVNCARNPTPDNVSDLLQHIDAQQTELTRLRAENERLVEALQEIHRVSFSFPSPLVYNLTKSALDEKGAQ